VPQQIEIRINQATDEEIVDLYLKTQKDQYFSEIYRRYSGKIFGKCLSFFKEEAEATDAVHDIFIKILINLSKFGEKSKFSTWIYSITYNYCIDSLRKSKKMNIQSIDNIGEEVEFEDENEDNWMTDIEMSQIEKVMDNLHPQDKAVLLMKYMDDMSIKEICGIMEKTESAIKMKLKRAKQRFRESFVKLN
jgi:RNA polymerase sigma factor (sigma-70 family)